MNKKSFIIYCDSLDVLDVLTREEAGELFLTIRDYVRGEQPKPSKTVEVAFIPIKNSIDRDLEKWKVVRERNIVNGKKGGRPAKSNIPNKPKKPSGLSGNPKNPVNVNVNVNDIILSKDNRESKTPVVYGNERIGKIIRAFNKMLPIKLPDDGRARRVVNNMLQVCDKFSKGGGVKEGREWLEDDANTNLRNFVSQYLKIKVNQGYAPQSWNTLYSNFQLWVANEGDLSKLLKEAK